MNAFYRLSKLIIISFVVFISANLLTIKPALANHIPAGFGAGTVIATPNGNIVVEDLQKGDRVIGYNFETHRQRENTVREIKQKQSFGYYLINEKTKLASHDLIYKRTLIRPELVRLNQIEPYNKLFGRESYLPVVNSIAQSVKPTDIYQIVLDNREGNLYADGILVHVGYNLPAYFKNQHVDCKPGTPHSKQCASVNVKTLPGFLTALSIIAIALTVISKAIDKIFGYMSDQI